MKVWRWLLPALVYGLLPVQVARADVLDLTTRGATGELGGAIFYQIDPQPTGTGVVDPFLRLQNKGSESGYNTDGRLEFDTKPSIHTHSLQLGSIPVVEQNGVAYREFFLDINESKPRTLLSLDEMKIHVDDAGNLSGYPQNFSDPVFDLDTSGDNWVSLNYELNHGSGSGDMRVLVPSELFGTDPNKYVTLYSAFGQNQGSDAGFEEWWVRQTDQNEPVPEPASLALSLVGGGALVSLLQRKKRRTA